MARNLLNSCPRVDNQGEAVSSSKGGIIGGVVGGVAGVALLGAAAWFFRRRRNASSSAQAGASPPGSDPDTYFQELDGRSRPQPSELGASPVPHEMPSRY